MTRVLTLSLVMLLGSLASAEDWGGFRNTTGSAVSNETTLPITWSETEGIRYKVALPGRGLSNPVIAGGRIYLTACSGYREKRLHVLCLDEETGKKIWERQFTATGNTSCHPVTNMAAPTPVTDGQAVYALFATGDLAALDREGSLLWYRSIVGDYPTVSNQVGMASSPVLAGNVLCLTMDNVGDSFLAGIDKRTGKNLWKIKRSRSINWTTPIVVNSGDVIFQNGEEATAIEPTTGKVRWTLKGDWSTIPSSTAGEGKIFLTAAQMKAIQPKQGSDKPEVLWEGGAITGGYASPVYYKGRIYGLTRVALVCLSAEDGSELSRQRVEGPFDGSPIIANGKLYAVNNKGRTWVFELSGEKPTQLARNDLKDTIQATPALANGRLYLRSDKYLYCIGSK